MNDLERLTSKVFKKKLEDDIEISIKPLKVSELKHLMNAKQDESELVDFIERKCNSIIKDNYPDATSEQVDIVVSNYLMELMDGLLEASGIDEAKLAKLKTKFGSLKA